MKFPTLVFSLCALLVSPTSWAADDRSPLLEPIHVAFDALRAGNTLPNGEAESCHELFLLWVDATFEEFEVDSNTKLPEPQRTDFYIEAMRMAIIHPAQHAGWPFRSALRLAVMKSMKQRIKKKDDPFLRFCVLFPSLDQGDQDFAVECYKVLAEEDKYLAGQTADWLFRYYRNAPKREAFAKEAGIAVPAPNEE